MPYECQLTSMGELPGNYLKQLTAKSDDDSEP